MAESIKSSFTGAIILPLRREDETAERRITIYEPYTNADTIAAAISTLSSYIRDTVETDRQWFFQTTGWNDGDTASVQQPDWSADKAWSISASEPIKFEITQKTVTTYGENYDE